MNLVRGRWVVGRWISNDLTGSVNRRLFLNGFEWLSVNCRLFWLGRVLKKILNHIVCGFGSVS